MSLAKTARNARNAVIAEAALAFARDRLARNAKPRRRRPGVKTLLFGALAAGGVAVALKRDKVRALLPGRSEEPAPPPAPAYTPPPVSNYDAAGPVANTATAVPVPPPHEEADVVDEAAEEAAAAAEAANIGGPDPDYAGAEAEPAAPAEEPLDEAGEGESEGAEQADADLAEPADASGEAAPEPPPADGEWRTWSGRSVNP